MSFRRFYFWIVQSTCLLFLLTEPAQAYLDPATGSIILQGLIAGIAIAVTTCKLWWFRFTSFFSPKKKDSEGDSEKS